MKFIKIFSLIILTCLSPKSLSINLHDVAKITYNNNLGIKIHKKQMEINILQSSLIASEILPKISAEITSYNQFNNNSSFNNRSNYLGIFIDQEIFSGGRTLIKLAQNNLNAKKAYNKYNKNINDIIYSAIESYQSIIFYRAKIKIREENVRRYQLFLQNVTLRHENGATIKEEIFYAKARLSTAKLDLLNDEVELRKNEEKFLAISGIKSDYNVQKININKFKPFPSKTFFIRSSIINNPEIISKRIEINTNYKNLLLKKTDILPIVRIQLQSRQELENNSFNQNKMKSIGITISLPILNKAGTEYMEIKSSLKLLEAAKLDLENTINAIKAESNNMWNMFDKYRKIIDELILIQNYYYKTIQSLEYKLNNKAITIANLLDRQTQYNDSTIQNIEAEELGYKLMFFTMHRHLGTLPKILNIKQ